MKHDLKTTLASFSSISTSLSASASDDHHGGLAHDLEVIRRASVQRREVLRWALGASLLPLIGCDHGSPSSAGNGTGGAGTGGAGSGGGGTGGGGGNGSGGMGTGGSPGTGGSTTTGTCSSIPEETAGPYPGDGSNGPNVLNQAGIVRGDIRSSFGTSTGTATGVPLTVSLTLVAANGGCSSLAGRAVYLWHCDQSGLYSLYSAGVADKNYLRGVQATDGSGVVSFTTIFPACYSGRWPHIHFEIYASLDAALAGGSKVATSQLALPQDACNQVFATSGYEASVTNLQRVTLASDMVFSDGATLQIPTVTGDVTAGYQAALTVAVPS